MKGICLSPQRRIRVLTLGLTAAISLYALLIVVAEPLRTVAATTANTVVQMTVNSNLSLTCTDTATIPAALGSGTSGTGSIGSAVCTPVTNNSLGYTLSWLINTSSGTVTPPCTGNCYGTGHLLSNNVTGGKPDAIRAFDRKAGFVNVPGRFDDTTIVTGSGSRWAARLRANSSTTGGASVVWGSDGATEGYLNVGTGSAVNIARRTSATSPGGDTENLLYKVVIPSGVFQPTGTYKTTILFTITDN
jgi:hypothetical protein